MNSKAITAAICKRGGGKIKEAMAQMPDLRTEIRDLFAEDDKVVCRCVWQGTEQTTGERLEYHGFVQWRIQNGRISEHWETSIQLTWATEHLKQW